VFLLTLIATVKPRAHSGPGTEVVGKSSSKRKEIPNMSTNSLKPMATEAHLDAIIAAAGTVIPPGKTFDFGGKPFSGAQLVQLFTGHVAPYKAIHAARAQAQQQEKARDGQAPLVASDIATLKGTLIGMFGAGAPELTQFGFKAPKVRTPLTVEQKLARAAKAKATRTLRGTKGSRQKQAVQATGQVHVTTNLVANPAPTPAPATTVVK
jgi:hypothetical protein